MFTYCLLFIDGFDLHDDNNTMADGADVVAQPVGVNQMTNEGVCLFIYLPYGILH
jgi:hypothetical protein